MSKHTIHLKPAHGTQKLWAALSEVVKEKKAKYYNASAGIIRGINFKVVR